jgi:hypothetical protein
VLLNDLVPPLVVTERDERFDGRAAMQISRASLSDPIRWYLSETSRVLWASDVVETRLDA